MRSNLTTAGVLILALLNGSSVMAQTATAESDFQQMAAALKANDAERKSAIDTCIEQGIGQNPTAAAEFMGVSVEKAAEAWCVRVTNGIAEGRMTLADVSALYNGDVTPAAREVLTTASDGH